MRIGLAKGSLEGCLEVSHSSQTVSRPPDPVNESESPRSQYGKQQHNDSRPFTIYRTDFRAYPPSVPRHRVPCLVPDRRRRCRTSWRWTCHPLQVAERSRLQSRLRAATRGDPLLYKTTNQRTLGQNLRQPRRYAAFTRSWCPYAGRQDRHGIPGAAKAGEDG